MEGRQRPVHHRHDRPRPVAHGHSQGLAPPHGPTVRLARWRDHVASRNRGPAPRSRHPRRRVPTPVRRAVAPRAHEGVRGRHRYPRVVRLRSPGHPRDRPRPTQQRHPPVLRLRHRRHRPERRAVHARGARAGVGSPDGCADAAVGSNGRGGDRGAKTPPRQGGFRRRGVPRPRPPPHQFHRRGPAPPPVQDRRGSDRHARHGDDREPRTGSPRRCDSWATAARIGTARSPDWSTPTGACDRRATGARRSAGCTERGSGSRAATANSGRPKHRRRAGIGRGGCY